MSSPARKAALEQSTTMHNALAKHSTMNDWLLKCKGVDGNQQENNPNNNNNIAMSKIKELNETIGTLSREVTVLTAKLESEIEEKKSWQRRVRAVEAERDDATAKLHQALREAKSTLGAPTVVTSTKQTTGTTSQRSHHHHHHASTATELEFATPYAHREDDDAASPQNNKNKNNVDDRDGESGADVVDVNTGSTITYLQNVVESLREEMAASRLHSTELLDLVFDVVQMRDAVQSEFIATCFGEITKPLWDQFRTKSMDCQQLQGLVNEAADAFALLTSQNREQQSKDRNEFSMWSGGASSPQTHAPAPAVSTIVGGTSGTVSPASTAIFLPLPSQSAAPLDTTTTTTTTASVRNSRTSPIVPEYLRSSARNNNNYAASARRSHVAQQSIVHDYTYYNNNISSSSTSGNNKSHINSSRVVSATGSYLRPPRTLAVD
eukprot:PhM_4_TR2130/c1_g1_i1/m.54205